MRRLCRFPSPVFREKGRCDDSTCQRWRHHIQLMRQLTHRFREQVYVVDATYKASLGLP